MYTLLIFMLMQPPMIFDFTADADLSKWRIVDDVVMGGVSDGSLTINEEGHGHYHGEVSLDNNGGFSSVRLYTDPIDVSDYSKVVLRVKGDGKRYQLRVKDKRNTWYSYAQYFTTASGEWITVTLPFQDFYPTFRGRKLDMDNFDGSQISELAILIGNKRNEVFDLQIDYIKVQKEQGLP